jgi:hypothetical protein
LKKIDISVRRTDSLTYAEVDEIWDITARYIDADRAAYEAKLRALPEVALWRLRGGELVGLVCLHAYAVKWQGRTSTIIFTSSVVIDEAFRGRNLVLLTGLRVLLREKLRRPLAPVYWFFDTFSYKSYLLLPRNFAEFWPRRDCAMPQAVAGFVDHLARHRYADDWASTPGIVRGNGGKRLRATTAPIDATLLADPDVQFFVRANPGHRDGDMLVCLAPLSLRNLGGAIARMIRRRPGAVASVQPHV